MVVARVRLNRIDTDAYAQCFKAIFDAVSKDHPMFKIGVSLNGIIADWSANDLEIAIAWKDHGKWDSKGLPGMVLAIKLALFKYLLLLAGN